ncbi:hypothetical protein OKA04_23785 [Luteolibacter flavescens]|uniref:Carboxypeptidase regulatory-like domain-containing protein n=1 Tax=Luteolibacter flavescens TaxID=1859460 RepID=A0ABT3FW23_9BACT|nr:hypothetical protein [Luteolibacter flavescens]MCW1887780.1 hypothetical protein [Luteolibacter flavescens]
MRATLGAIALALASGVLGWSLGDRDKATRQFDYTVYQPALYSLHVRAVDVASGEPLAMKVSWDEEVSPFVKGSGPCMIEEFADGSESIHVTGLPLAGGLGFTISAEGYKPETITVWGHGGGIRTSMPDDVVTVKLEKQPTGN